MKNSFQVSAGELVDVPGAAVLAQKGLALWTPLLTALVVGLHFLPLARLFEVALYYWTGGTLVLLAIACALIPEPSLRLRVLGLSVGATLWLTAGRVLFKTRLFARPGKDER
jgi:hypothetical protein